MSTKPLNPAKFTLKFIKEVDFKILKGGNKKRYALFECPKCGKQFETSVISAYRSSKCRSCATKENNTKHGLSHNKLYHVWCGILQRCYNVNYWQYCNYGARGISIYEEWKDNPNLFISYVSNLPNAGTPRFSLDRINNNGNYEPNNLRWASPLTQAHNSRKGFYGKSKYVGVTIQEYNKKWKSTLHYMYKKYVLGVFNTEKEAAIAYDNKVEELNLTNKIKNKDKYPDDF